MQIDTEPASPSGPPPRVPSPMIMVTDQDAASSSSASSAASAAAASTTASGTTTSGTTSQLTLTPTRERKKSPATGVAPRQRKRSQPVRGELLPDPDKLLSYKHHDKKEDDLEDPTFPGGLPKPPPEPRAPGQPAERKRSNVTFCPVVETIEK
ncbi:uncharacterized protein LOC128986446 [Macrosteles quadrilineatus]|uniref:uncharacterized protein LOC128986446 n=1 Tax=Macrosteles quadrilineatus TaxID=74068 RepID=UPI0023E312DB|nr:uncharacterized protein LOC128986446 [Macrosteles quadrilineatus]XP_054262799.1 uncharacterized protein LOC128986446 [Macrosteles quadrilineatus]XP_054262800.1 uncharacterized protein LOC128986446 [Macrosteles quadrilineatus]